MFMVNACAVKTFLESRKCLYYLKNEGCVQKDGAPVRSHPHDADDAKTTRLLNKRSVFYARAPRAWYTKPELGHTKAQTVI